MRIPPLRLDAPVLIGPLSEDVSGVGMGHGGMIGPASPQSMGSSRPDPRAVVANQARLRHGAGAAEGRCTMRSPAAPGFSVRADVRNGVARLALTGELDAAVAAHLQDQL